MFTQRFHQRAWIWMTLGLCALTVMGCAGLPRIDPTGERLFIWPQDQVSAVPPLLSNAQAPPVFTDPVFPTPTLTPTITPAAGQFAVPVPPVPQDTLSITPQRVLAPVGSEVLLKSRFCTREGYLLTDAKVDWMIARESAGEFVSLGGRGWMRDPLLPWNQSKKIDNQYATGYTAKVPLTITRGTADLSDDVLIEPGESWASITSPVEGTSHITAVAPEIETWKERRATATIHWVDVQWTFPPPSITAGSSHVLTTTVRRQTDGTPLEGWTVRYEVADGVGTLTGSQSGQVVESTTDAAGQASIDVTPTGNAGSTTRMNIQLVRPQGYRGSNAPQLIVANGTTLISWTGSGTDYLPPADNFGGSIPTGPIPDQPQSAVRRPILDIEIFGEENAQVGGQTRVEVVIHNRGDAEATQIVLNDRFDEGLEHIRDPLRNLQIENSSIERLAAGDSRSLILNFDVKRAGRLCHTVTVRCTEGVEAQKLACFNATQPPPPLTPDVVPDDAGPPPLVVPPTTPSGAGLRLKINPLFADEARARTSVSYQIILLNGPVADEQVQLSVTFPAEMTPDVEAITSDANVQATVDGNVLRFEPIAQIRANKRLVFRIPFYLNQPGVRNLIAEVVSRNAPAPIREIEKVTIISR